MMVFVDTHSFIAWLYPRDADHKRVSAYLAAYKGRLLTTEWVLMELANGFSAPATRLMVVGYLKDIRVDPQFEIVGYDQAVYQAGFDLFASRADKAWSLTDCISFVVMRERGLTEALTADHHFEQAGFQAIFR